MKEHGSEGADFRPPALRRDANGEVEASSLAAVIEWFLRYDPRVAVINHPAVQELFEWKRREDERIYGETFAFSRAEDRLAIGIFQALATYKDEHALYEWIGELLAALDEARRTNEEIASAYRLQTAQGASALEESSKIPTARERAIYLTSCWLEALCTAEIRVLGWVYQDLYGRGFHPHNF
ncbi:hypothetical protein [Pyrinomonas methylaliphatogenes]|jgi:hypothetical protein|uniref:Uncharacterized protein n=1 Tax=Pyrinomonas methylaliphatogenes TaxID=454194 RepID=A0A0B6X1E4_9BACT|nr:hypothetical protein [Pyrinomonas methylaliphatogenes]MBX5477773.1 hypothetical protein [Pyrinomonas methylaliphatogenes]CDM66822.1 hypothetical protein PYK22_02860 [Pyrinomonas methylaliphatogenes]